MQLYTSFVRRIRALPDGSSAASAFSERAPRFEIRAEPARLQSVEENFRCKIGYNRLNSGVFNSQN